jgi:hypothetical protein
MRRLKAGIYNNKIYIAGHNKKLEIFTPTFDPTSDKKYYLARENYRFTLDDPTKPSAIWYKITSIVNYNTAVIDIPFIGASGDYFVNMFASPYVGAELNIGQKFTYNNKIYTITTNQFSLGQLQITTTPPIDTEGHAVQYPESFYYFSSLYNSLNMSMDNIQDKWNYINAPVAGLFNSGEWNFSEDCVSFMEWQAALIVFTTKTAWAIQQTNDYNQYTSGYNRPSRLRIPQGILTFKSVLEKNNNIYLICKD